MEATLYAIPGSNAVCAAQLALEWKGVQFKRVDQLPVIHRITMKLRGFDGSTVPGMAADGRKWHGSRAIMLALDELKPEPRLYPEEPERRAAVDGAVTWGEEVYQRTFRSLLPYSLLRRPEAVRPVLDLGGGMSVPKGMVAAVSKPALLLNAQLNKSDDEGVRRALAELPSMLDRVDALIAEGTLDADNPGAADAMIAPTSRALLWWQDLAPLVEDRPAAEHARRLAPRYEAAIPPVLPRDALPVRAA